MDTPALCGGEAIRKGKKPLYYAHQDVTDSDIQAVVNVLKSDYLTTGPAILQMEKDLSKITGAKYAVAVCNGTAALHIACMAAGIGTGYLRSTDTPDEVITTPITFSASANCAVYCGAKPVFADIDPDTWEIDPACVEKLVNKNTRAVIPVDYTGQTADLDAVKDICTRNDLVMIEDAAHSIGTVYKGRNVGSIADITTMSFHAIKTVTGGEGGAVLTDNKEYFDRLMLYRTHGITRDPSLLTHPSEGPWYYELTDLSMNYRITDIQAALISSQLGRLDELIARRKMIRQMYDEAFAGIPQLILQRSAEGCDAVRHLYVIRLNPSRLTTDRRTFFEALTAEGIGCNVNYIPVYRLPYYEKLGYRKGLCPNAEALYENMISIPMYSAMTKDDALDVIKAVAKLCEYYGR